MKSLDENIGYTQLPIKFQMLIKKPLSITSAKLENCILKRYYFSGQSLIL